ncbi:hypothetical protein [Microvirgula aerodenitrificans]|uniref:hypothetical protein n=1 Tax=Microvirgula aerodenitrificans TaxID=57480 RepID=UPI002F406777
MLSGTLKSMASGGAQSLVHGVRPNWGRIAAESFGNNVGHQVVGSAVEQDREQQQQRQPQAIRREVAGQNDAVGYRDDGGLQARAETAWRQQERRRQAAIAEVQSLERAADVSLNGEAMLDEIVVTASRLPLGGEPGAMQRARDAYSEALKDALIGTGQILSDQMYFRGGVCRQNGKGYDYALFPTDRFGRGICPSKDAGGRFAISLPWSGRYTLS